MPASASETPISSWGAVCDAVGCASQLGRLDLVSVLLAILGLLLALAGVVAFFDLRKAAKDRATEVARVEAERAAEGAAVRYLEAELPRLVEEYMELAANAATDEAANQIALAQEDERG